MSGELAQEFCSEKINPVLQKGLTELCRAKPADPIVSCGTADARAFLRHRPLFVDNPLSFVSHPLSRHHGPPCCFRAAVLVDGSLAAAAATVVSMTGRHSQNPFAFGSRFISIQMWLAQWLLDNNPAKPKVEEKPAVIFALGAPGSGMNTECSKIQSDYGFTHLAPEALLQAETESDSDLGKQIKDLMLHGLPVPATTMVAILSNAIAASEGKKFVISNFPYAEEQAILFEKSVVPPTMVFQFDVSDATMMKNGRLSDANIANYKALAKPMVTKYTRSGQLTKINGDAMVDAVHDDVCTCLAAHFTPITTTPAQ